MKEKTIIDGAYGVNRSNSKTGYTDETMKDHESSETWMKEWDEERKWRNTGFGRERGEAR